MHGYNIQNFKDLYCYNLLVITYLFDSELNEQRRKLLQGYVKNIVEALQENWKPQIIKSSYPLVWKALKALHSTPFTWDFTTWEWITTSSWNPTRRFEIVVCFCERSDWWNRKYLRTISIYFWISCRTRDSNHFETLLRAVTVKMM